MAFKMSYSFEGNYRSRPEQNLSGNSKKQTRDVLIQHAHEERQKRQAERLKLKSTEIVQSYTRSYLARKKIKQEQRLLFDANKNQPNLDYLITRLLFFYDAEHDLERLFFICERLQAQPHTVTELMAQNSAFNWLIKRLLMICLRTLAYCQCPAVIIQSLDVFSQNGNVILYLIKKGYYRYLRVCLENTNGSNESILNLITRPFLYVQSDDEIKSQVLINFSKYFLCSQITSSIKVALLPYIIKQGTFPYNDFIKYLCQETCDVDNSNSLLYCLLSLEPPNFVQNEENIQILSTLTSELHTLLTVIEISDDNSDEEEMEVSSDYVNIQDYLALFNRQDRVKKILKFFCEHSGNEVILKHLTNLVFNLLLIYKNLKKFLLVFTLALTGTFLNKLWLLIKQAEGVIMQSSSGNISAWKEYHIPVSVFCDMFTFYTETLTDSESTDTSHTFTNEELNSMSELLKTVSLNMIELAFPMCRSNVTRTSTEILHLYHSSLSALKKLYTLNLRKNFCEVDFWTKRKIHISNDLTKKNYLSKTIRPFYGLIPENDDDEHLPPLSTIELRSLAILQELPFLLEFNQRVLLLRQLCYYSFGSPETRFRYEFLNNNVITVRRSHLYEDAFDKLSQRNESDLRHKVRILFINSAGVEEEGIDGGGIFKEFINEVLKTAFDPNRGFFLLTGDNMLYPNPQVHLIVENFMDHYYFIGRLVGKAIYENILVDLPLAEFFLAKILVDNASAHYLKSLDPILYRNLLYLRDYKGDVQDLGLDFTLVNNDLGETRVIELQPNGSNIPVTNDNRLQYIHNLADLKLNTQIKKQCKAFCEGLDSVVPLLWLKLFNHNELQVIIAGDTQEMDIEDLRAHTTYGGEYTAEHQTIKLFWKILRSFTDTQKKMLLKFVTSCSRPPLLGFKELYPSFCINSSGTEDRMPTASTCLNLLKLPIISDEETLRRKLLSSIEQQAGFELS